MTTAELKAARLNKGLTLRAAAKEMGVSRETLRNVENGARPGAVNGKLIADYFGVKPTDIWPVEPPVAA